MTAVFENTPRLPKKSGYLTVNEIVEKNYASASNTKEQEKYKGVYQDCQSTAESITKGEFGDRGDGGQRRGVCQ